MLDIGKTEDPVCSKQWELISLMSYGRIGSAPMYPCPISPTLMLLFQKSNYKQTGLAIYLYDTTMPLVKKKKTTLKETKCHELFSVSKQVQILSKELFLTPVTSF